jgi:glycolate oxidase iron-sulfur subunit
MIKPPPTPEKPSSITKLADQCVQCGLCLPHCPTYQLDRHEAESPRGRIAYMKAVDAQQLARSAKGELHLQHCLGCRRCEAACPADVRYGQLFELSQADNFKEKTPLFFDRLYWQALAKPTWLNMLLPLARVSHRLPAVPAVPATPSNATANRHAATIKHSQQVAIFEGCVAKSYERSTRVALTHMLDRCDIGVIDSPQQICCGAAAMHQGDHEISDALIKQNRAAFAHKMPVISLASGCHDAILHSLSMQNQVIDACDFLALHRAKLRFKAADRSVALHIPCTQSTVVKSADSLRSLLSMVPNLALIELPDQGCCGAAGMHMLSYPERADALRKPLLQAIENAQVSEIISANIGCRLHIANACKLPVRHPIDFLAEHLL